MEINNIVDSILWCIITASIIIFTSIILLIIHVLKQLQVLKKQYIFLELSFHLPKLNRF